MASLKQELSHNSSKINLITAAILLHARRRANYGNFIFSI